MWIRASLLIFCLLLQSCSLTFSPWGNRSPSSIANFEETINKMKNFKARLMGSEKDANCSKEALDEDFKRLLASVKRDSCSKDNFSIDREEFNQKACPKVKIEGYFDRVVKATIQEEKSKKKQLTYFQDKIDPEFLKFFNEAQTFLKSISTQVNSERFEKEERAQLLAAYVENVLLPIRDVVVIKRSYLPKEDDGKKYYLQLQPYLTEDFVSSLGVSEMGLITQGPNPGASPFYLELKPIGNRLVQLAFSPTDIIRRDVITLLKAPSSKNYVIALKWMTLHMMLSQVYLYDTILGNRAPLRIPNSCQNHFNGNLPSEFKFNYEEGIGEQFLENILAGHGLTFKQDDISYLDYYIDNVNKDPTKEGYSGLVPFENYKNARVSSAESTPKDGLEPHFDDIAHFPTIMSFKLGEAQSVFRGKVAKQNVIYSGNEIFQKITGEFPADEIAEIKLADGSVQQIYPGKQNLSPYLLELMQKNGFVDYTQLITEKLKKKFVGKRALIDFPSMYSSPVWRDWSLKTLADLVHEYRDMPQNAEVHRLLVAACNRTMNTRSPEMVNICLKGNRIQNLDEFLSEFRSGDKYIPTRRLEEKKFQGVYPLLSLYWKSLRDGTELLAEAKPFELNFLLDQMSALNPWARLKLGYMVALDQLEHQREGIPPAFDFRGMSRKVNEQAICDIKLNDLQYRKIKEAGEVLGLDQTISYNHASRFLSNKEKKQVWRNIIDDIGQRNAQLFSVRSGNKDFYQIAEDLSYKTILSEEAARNTGINISANAQNEISKISKTTEAQIGNFFLKLYAVKNPEEQKNLFEQFSKVNGIDNAFSLKLNFLAVDDAYKKPIYKDILKQAAQARKLQILSHLETFCKMDINDEMQFKNIFYSTTKAQNELNQMAGLPSIPADVLDQINSMSSSEWRDMWWGIGSGVAGIAALVVGGACTTLSGGICAPLGGVMAVAGLSALGIQVKLTSNELDRKVEADHSEKQVKVMEELGFANSGSADEVHRSYAWAAFEAISVFPLIGVATRSLALGPKLVYVSSQSLLRQTGKTSFKAAAKSVTQEEEVRAARYLLGIDGVAKNAGVDTKTLNAATTKIEKIRKLYTAGEIDFETMIAQIGKVIDPIKRAKLAALKTIRKEIGHVTIRESQGQIDAQTAKMVADYFGDNPKELLRLIQGYSGEKLNRAVKIMNEVNATDRINRIPIFSGVKDWFLRMRNESLAKNASKILRIEKELSTMSSKPGQLQSFVNKNIEDLTDIFVDIPMKKREIPYFVFVQGMPEFNFYKGRKIPLLSIMSEGQTIRRVFTARARLVHESYKFRARETFKLKRYVQSETTLGAYRAFQLSIAELASRKSGAEAAKILSDYRRVEEQLARKLYVAYSKTGQKMEYKAFKEMMMNPASIKDKATLEAIWESVPADELMGIKELGEVAHKAVQELSKYNNIDSFERYLGALKVLIINRNPAILEVM